MTNGEDASGVTSRAIAAGLGSVAGLASGDAAGSVVGAAAGVALEPLMAAVWTELRGDAQARAGAVFRVGAEAVGDSPGAFEKRVSATERSRLLAATAMDAGMRTAWHPKVRALGRALAAGLANDEARVDEGQLLIGALADLEAPHARVLALLVTKKWDYSYRLTGRREKFWHAIDAPESERPPRGFPDWTDEQIELAIPALIGVVPSLLGTLQRHGLVMPRYDLSEVLESLATDNDDGTFTISTGGPDEPIVTWSATELGVRLHALLHEAAGQA